jgi:hypothetical protein
MLSSDGACKNLPEHMKQWFFGKDYGKARKICKSCPITEECLAEALEMEEPGERRFGVRGGLTANDRTKRYG